MTGDDERRALGARLKEAREYAGLSQEDVSKITGIARSAISLSETGQRRVDALELKKLAGVYGRSVSELTGEVVIEADEADVEYLARTAKGLSQNSRHQLLDFARYLESRSRQEKNK